MATGVLLERAAWPPEIVPLLDVRLREAAELPPELVQSIASFNEADLDHFINEVDARVGKSRKLEAQAVLKNKLIESRFHLNFGLELLDRRGFDLRKSRRSEEDERAEKNRDPAHGAKL